MTHKNLKIEKKKQYNPFVTRTIKRAAVGNVKIYLRAVKPNPRDAFGATKATGFWYNERGCNVTRSHPQAEQYDPTKIYFYEVGANDGSYRKCSTKEDALKAFGLLVEFEKRQTEVR